ncbi:MAG: hypothetical protein JKX84_03955 [Flavobacteriales bacterium]|nr:hypothetical protein [Flavobacteriales bacterium]
MIRKLRNHLTNEFNELKTEGILSESDWTLEGPFVQIKAKSGIFGEEQTELKIKFFRVPTNGGGQRLPEPATPSLLGTVIFYNMRDLKNSWVIDDKADLKYTENEIIEKIGNYYDDLNKSIGRTQLKPVGI